MPFKKYSKLILIITCAMMVFSHQAEAVSKRVSSPNVSQGLGVDTRGSFSTDDDDADDFRIIFKSPMV